MTAEPRPHAGSSNSRPMLAGSLLRLMKCHSVTVSLCRSWAVRLPLEALQPLQTVQTVQALVTARHRALGLAAAAGLGGGPCVLQVLLQLVGGVSVAVPGRRGPGHGQDGHLEAAASQQAFP